MAQMVLIMGESGTGKSTSMRNCNPETIAVVNPVGKPLPFKNHFDMLNNETDARKITKYMKEQAAAGKKLIVVDDFQYILAVPYMNRIKETGWDTHAPLAVGLTADIKVGTRLSYEVIKIDGEERFCEWDIEPGEKYDELPKYFFPVRASADFVDMDAGDGRNQALFNYILTLTANDFSVDETRECIRILNKFVLKESLSDDELEVILRDEAFQKPVFYNGSTFLFDRFRIVSIVSAITGIDFLTA